MRRYPNEHPDEESLEAYAIGTLRGIQLARLEEHLLICEGCQVRMQEVDSFVTAIREAAAHLMGTVVVTHATTEGAVRLEARKQARRKWEARLEGPDLEGAETFPSFRAAFDYLERSFAKMYPKHRCTAECRRGDMGAPAPLSAEAHPVG